MYDSLEDYDILVELPAADAVDKLGHLRVEREESGSVAHHPLKGGYDLSLHLVFLRASDLLGYVDNHDEHAVDVTALHQRRVTQVPRAAASFHGVRQLVDADLQRKEPIHDGLPPELEESRKRWTRWESSPRNLYSPSMDQTTDR